jgi:hypothetical protein
VARNTFECELGFDDEIEPDDQLEEFLAWEALVADMNRVDEA